MEKLRVKTVSANVEEAKPANASWNMYSYDDAMELTGNGRYNYLHLAVCSVISHAVALDIFGFCIIVAASSCDLNLTTETKGLLTSIPFAGIIFAFPWGYYADTCGRRKALIWSTGIGFLFAALSSLASTWYIMVVLKFIGSSFSTAALGLTMTYLGECTGSKHRSRYLQIMNSCNLACDIVSFLLALFILPLDFTTAPLPLLNINYRPWRLLTFLLAMPLGLGAILITCLHESPKFLVNKGEVDKALGVLENMFVVNGGKGMFPAKIYKTAHIADVSEKTSFWSSIVMQSVPIFKPPLLWKTVQLFYLLLIICSTNNVFSVWFPMILNSFFASLENENRSDVSFCNRIFENGTKLTESGLNNSELCDDVVSYGTIYAGIAYGVFYTGLNLLVCLLSGHRRMVLLIMFTVSIASCILLNLVHNPIANMIFYVTIQVTAVGVGIGGSYFVDTFPTKHSALATGLGLMVGRVGSFAGVNIIGLAIENYCDVAFYSWGAFVFSGLVVTLLLPSDKQLKSQF